MITPLSALVAYRKDVAHLGHGTPLTSELDDRLSRWLAFAAMLERLAASRNAADPLDVSRALETMLREFADAPTGESILRWTHSPSRPLELRELSELARRVADEVEQGGALWLAYSMLATLERIEGELPALEAGRMLAQRARVARKADASEIAEALYKRVAKLGRTAGEPELTARAAIGFGVLAQMRGNLPSAARHFERAARVANRVQNPELVGVAQHGRMTIAASRGAFADALRYGWAAFSAAVGDREREAEMLLNLAQLAFDTGHPRAALQGFAAALQRRPGPRLMLPALGGAARAAAALGRTDVVSWCATRLSEATRADGFAYPKASALLDLALALAGTAPAQAAAIVQRALNLTSRFKFHELEHHLRMLEAELELRQATPRAAPPTSITVGARGEEILRQIEQLDGMLVKVGAG
jgi:tetratricopeptide (TPR) repeat protein